MNEIQQNEDDKTGYLSYNGLGRNPMFYGIPYMTGLAVFTTSVILGMLLGNFVTPAGWFAMFFGIPVLWYVKGICKDDDRAVDLILLEAKWVIIKMISGGAKYFGGTLTISPITFGRRSKYVKRYFKNTTSG